MALSWSRFIKVPEPKKEKKTARKMRDVSVKKRKAELKKRAEKVSKMGQRTVDNELRLMQKKANERMRQLEIQGIKSPAYQAVQAKLEILGKERKGERGRRFSETGRGTYNEKEMQKRILREFLEAETSTLKGAKGYYDKVWETAKSNNNLAQSNITRDQWFEFFENMPDKKKDRMFYSQQVKIFTSFMRKNGNLVNEGKITVADIAESIQESEKINQVFDKLNDLYEIETKKKGQKPDKDGFITLTDL